MTNDDLRARYKLAHDVSHRYDWVGAPEQLKLCRKRSMMRMTPPQSGQAGTLAHVRASEIHRRRLAIVWRCPLTIEKFAAKGEFGSAMAVGHEAEVADAMEAIGQRVKKEAADELVGLELHDLCRAVLSGSPSR